MTLVSDATKDRIGATIRLLLNDALVLALSVLVMHVFFGRPINADGIVGVLLTLLVLSRWEAAGFLADVSAKARAIRDEMVRMGALPSRRP